MMTLCFQDLVSPKFPAWRGSLMLARLLSVERVRGRLALPGPNRQERRVVEKVQKKRKGWKETGCCARRNVQMDNGWTVSRLLLPTSFQVCTRGGVPPLQPGKARRGEAKVRGGPRSLLAE